MRNWALSSGALALGALALASLVSIAQPLRAQETKAAPATSEYTGGLTREQLIAAARELMTAQQFCAFITVDKAGKAQVRTINPFPPEEDLTVWFATRDNTRKAQEARDNPNVVVYYADHGKGTGYVALSGKAVLVSDKAEIQKRHRAYWDQAFPGQKGLVLIKIVPEHLEVINYKAGTKQDSLTWRAPNIDLGAKK